MESIHILFFLAMIISALCLYNKLPENIPMHWNAGGQIDGYGSRNTIFILPVTYLIIYLLLLFLPTIDVFKENVKKSFKNYFGIRLSMGLFFLVLYLMILLTNFFKFDLARMLVIAICMLFASIGYFIKDIKRNYFAGIRTPWTLNNERVWNETHNRSGKLFILGGIILAIITLFVSMIIAFYLVVSLIILISIYSVAYSYVLFKRYNGKIYKK